MQWSELRKKKCTDTFMVHMKFYCESISLFPFVYFNHPLNYYQSIIFTMSIIWGQSYERHALTLIFLFNNLFWPVGTLSLLPKKSKSLFWCCCRMTQMLDPQLSVLLHFHEGTHRTAKTQNKFRIIHYAPHQSDKPTPFWPN